VKNIRATLATVWRIASPYFRSEDKWAGCGLLAAVIALELSSVAVDVLINQWQNRFFNAIQDKDWDRFVWEIGVFCVIVTPAVVLAIYQLYLNQWLQIRWRNWMTRHYLGEWLEGPNHYRMQLLGDAADNPDQRITEDVKLFIDRTMDIGLGLLNSIVTLASFVVILWGLSVAAPLHLFEFAIPGYLVWGALIYSIFGTVLTQWIGSPLVNLDFEQQQREADFRFNLVRVRENSEQIALMQGEPAERERLMHRFGRVISNWYGIMSRTKRLTAFTQSYVQAAVIFPYILVAPAYFAVGSKLQLGIIQQAADAFDKVYRALSFFVTVYRRLAEWRAVVARLDGFEMSIVSARHLAASPSSVRITAGGGKAIELQQLLVRLPHGEPVVAVDALTLRDGERTLITGPSGAGKSTLFRAISGIWPFGDGAVRIPAGATLMMLPQRPYFPIGSLHAAVAYPSEDSAFGEAQVREVLTAVGLAALAPRLHQEAHWNRMLSLGEQQRLGVARALLHAPTFLFLDEATASLDEPSEAALYRLLSEKLPATTLVSIGHRSTLAAFHARKLSLVRDGDRFALREEVPVEAR